jgi:hypothetical protein
MFDEEYYCDEGPPPLLSKQPILKAIEGVDSSLVGQILIEVQRQTGELVEEDCPGHWHLVKDIVCNEEW